MIIPKGDHEELKILILCGGKGERLSPITNDIPKPLILINGIPILNYLISYFESYGFRKFIIATGYKSDKIVEYFTDHHTHLEIEIVDSGEADIVKRIQDALSRISGDFMMCYGDTLADVDIPQLIDFHRKHRGKITVTSYPLQSPFGILEINDEGRTIAFAEKPTLDKWINIGYFYFSKEAEKVIRAHKTFIELLHDGIERGELYSFRHKGVHITVNTIKELHDAEKNIGRLDRITGRHRNDFK